jgi:tetratricopeptide (TPR) repeat protein
MRAVLLAAALAAAAACGGPSASRRIQTSGPKPKAVVLDPVKPEARREFDGAMRALRLGGPEAPETAKARLAAAVEIDGKLWEAWHNLGVLRAADGDDDGAATAFDKALATNPAHAPTRVARAEALRRLGRSKDARGDYEQVLREAAPDDPLRRDAAARLASLLRDGGDYEGAVDVLRDTLRVSGANARIYTELALLYLAPRPRGARGPGGRQGHRARRQGPGRLQRAGAPVPAAGQGPGGLRPLRPRDLPRPGATSTPASTRPRSSSTPATTSAPRPSSRRSSRGGATTGPPGSRSGWRSAAARTSTPPRRPGSR